MTTRHLRLGIAAVSVLLAACTTSAGGGAPNPPVAGSSVTATVSPAGASEPSWYRRTWGRCTTTGRPTAAKSSKPKPGNCASRNRPLTTMFVVVRSVAMPPRMVPKESGIISFEGLTLALRATLLRPGRRTDAEAMLFMTRDSSADAPMVKAINRVSLRPATRNR